MDNVDTKEDIQIDLDEMSWGDAKDITVAVSKLQLAGTTNPAALVECFATVENTLGPLVISVPRSFLVKRAPEDIDFSKPGALNWIKKSRFVELLNKVMALINEVEEDSKN